MNRRLLLLVAPARARSRPCARAEAPRRAPETVGVSSERLQRLRAGMQRYVDEGRVSGLVVYVTRAGRVVEHEAFGKADVEAARPMAKDSIFRIASQTKALTSVAVMMLVEEGRVGLLRSRLEVHPRLREDDGAPCRRRPAPSPTRR